MTFAGKGMSVSTDKASQVRGASAPRGVARQAAGLLLALAASATSAPNAGLASEALPMAPHRAIYEMTLAKARGGSSVTQVSGRMVYELTGSQCEGYTQNMRFVTSMANQSGGNTLTDLRSSSWEDGAGKRFRFNSSQFRDEKPTEITAGDATRRNGAGIKVELTKPGKRDVSIAPDAYFPVQHSIALIEAAKAGKSFFRADLYDGSEKGEKVYDTVSAIGKKTRSKTAKGVTGKRVERMDNMTAWPVSIAYYEAKSDHRDAVPVYELSFLFLENGVSRDLLIDYGDFAIRGELKEIDFLDPSKCEKPVR